MGVGGKWKYWTVVGVAAVTVVCLATMGGVFGELGNTEITKGVNFIIVMSVSKLIALIVNDVDL